MAIDSPTDFTILAVDDDEEALFALESILQSEGYAVITAQNGQIAIEKAEELPPDIVITDVNMPVKDGFEVARAFKSDSVLRYSPVILLTSRDDLEDIVHGLQQGADDYLNKPYRKEELLARVQAALRTRAVYKELWQRNAEKQNRKEQAELSGSYANIVGSSSSMQEIFSLIEKVKDADAPVLITGESGTGKELVAQSLHNQSVRSEAPFVVQNCAALNEQLLESELFGHVKGAFTGAVRTKPGLFEVADGGTFFLDELGEMTLGLQVKLLRVLQDGSFTPVGGTETKKVQVRIVAATNRDLQEMVRGGTFREDLYYRLNVVAVSLPPLRERPTDIPLLVEHFLQGVAKRTGVTRKQLDVEAIDMMKAYPWPGNIRELQNEVERLCIMSGADTQITGEYLSAHIAAPIVANARGRRIAGNLKESVETLEKNLILDALRESDWNKSEAARELGISRSNLINKVKAYRLEDS
jgi:two-component system NtrC family response regulator